MKRRGNKIPFPSRDDNMRDLLNKMFNVAFSRKDFKLAEKINDILVASYNNENEIVENFANQLVDLLQKEGERGRKCI